MAPSGSRTPVVVLVVEDEPLQGMMVVNMVEEAGFEALEASDAGAAICILIERPDVRIMFTDIDMPGSMDGMKLAAAIRDRWPPIQITLVSGHGLSESALLPKGAVFFPKPYRWAKVVAEMRRMAA